MARFRLIWKGSAINWIIFIRPVRFAIAIHPVDRCYVKDVFVVTIFCVRWFNKFVIMIHPKKSNEQLHAETEIFSVRRFGNHKTWLIIVSDWLFEWKIKARKFKPSIFMLGYF